MPRPTPTADGQSVIFYIPDVGLFRSDLTGENREKIRDSKVLEFPTDISGEFLVFGVYSSERQNDIWWMRITPDGRPMPGAEAQPYLQTSDSEVPGRFAPGQNPRWLAYTSDKSGRHEVYVQSFPTKGKEVRISDGGGSHPVWRSDGREISSIRYG